ncbi:MAG: alginate lyase family protein [candidate division KSB1 bacterium]|nr:alginate lyase family protein [candidate division KSB1 bacterium]
MHKHTKIIILLAAVLLSCTPQPEKSMWPPSPASIGVEPNDDALVRAIAPGVNYGQDKTLSVEHNVSMAFLKFFIPGFSQIDSAILRIQTKDVKSTGVVSVHPVKHADWDETQPTWKNHPGISDTILVSLHIKEPNRNYQIDLTEYVQRKLTDKDYYICLCFKAEPGTHVEFASVEDYDNDKPRFMISGMTAVPSPPPQYAPAAFKHPGILATRDQIAFVRGKIAKDKSPWRAAFTAALEHKSAQKDYQPSPVQQLTRSGHYSKSVNSGYRELSRDAAAALVNAQLWALTDSLVFAENAIRIINAWSETNKAITGGNDKLTGGTTCIQFCNAAELLKHTDSGWQPQDQKRFEQWLRDVYWPLLRDFIPAYNGNWDAIIGQGLISMGIYLDDAFIFDHAVNYYVNGSGNGRMTYYVRNDSTTQETLRDQGHEQMGIGALAGIAETAWQQGVDLYSIENNRLLKGIEGTAKRVLDIDYRRLSIWESMYNHYHKRMGHDMPYTKQILTAPGGYRPEGYSAYRGFSTLFFYEYP